MNQPNKNNAITARDADFAQWYTDVCKKAELMDYSSVKGFIDYLPLWLCHLGRDPSRLHQ
jgi:prolyl-tRNA synthetase